MQLKCVLMIKYTCFCSLPIVIDGTGNVRVIKLKQNTEFSFLSARCIKMALFVVAQSLKPSFLSSARSQSDYSTFLYAVSYLLEGNVTEAQFSW